MCCHLFEFPLVSAVVPAYNAQKYISATLQSLVCQSYPNLEIIVADDGSSDQTSQFVKKWMKKDQAHQIGAPVEFGCGGCSKLGNPSFSRLFYCTRGCRRYLLPGQDSKAAWTVCKKRVIKSVWLIPGLLSSITMAI
jgi:glycosyltransferase involved in cell wall biosynthesis